MERAEPVHDEHDCCLGALLDAMHGMSVDGGAVDGDGDADACRDAPHAPRTRTATISTDASSDDDSESLPSPPLIVRRGCEPFA